MYFRNIALALGLALLSFTGQASESGRYLAEDLRDSFSYGTNTNSAQLSEVYKPSMGQSRVQMVIPSFVVHGMQPDPTVAAAMPNRLVNSGDAVTTPGFGLEYKSPDGLMLMGAVIKDCFNDLAGTVQIGGNWKINRDSDWAFTVGIYARETPLVCTQNANGSKTCYDVDGLDFKSVVFVNGESVDLIPLPFIHYSYNLYRSRDLQVNFKFMGNFVLNEFGLEIPL